MPLPLNIHALLDGEMIESERVEFKEGWNPEATLHTLCAFANDFHNLGGGYIVIGVAEKDGVPVLPSKGLTKESIDRIQKELLNLGNSAIHPYYHAITAPVVVNGKHILVLWALGGQTRPYKARVSLGKASHEMVYYIRKGSSTVKARGADERELLSLAATVPFDDRVNQRAKITDLSRDLIVKFLREIKSDLAAPARKMSLETLGRQLGIVAGPKEAPMPVNVGLLFFNKNPDRFFPATQIDVVWFPTDEGGDKFDEKVFKGPLAHITRDALDHIKRNYIIETVIKHHGRAESTRVENFPYDAIEEAVVNAVYHRGYDEREPIEIRISPRELLVVSYPGPDRSVRLSDFKRGRAVARRYRNRRIGEFLKELELTEGRSTGIPKIFHAMKSNGSPPPQFEFDDEHSFFITRLRVHPAAAKAAAQSATAPVTTTVATTVTATVRVLLDACRQESSREGLQKALGFANKMHFIKQYLRPALDAGLLERTIPTKPNSRLQKYRLTQKGRKALGR